MIMIRISDYDMERILDAVYAEILEKQKESADDALTSKKGE